MRAFPFAVFVALAAGNLVDAPAGPKQCSTSATSCSSYYTSTASDYCSKYFSKHPITTTRTITRTATLTTTAATNIVVVNGPPTTTTATVYSTTFIRSYRTYTQGFNTLLKFTTTTTLTTTVCSQKLHERKAKSCAAFNIQTQPAASITSICECLHISPSYTAAATKQTISSTRTIAATASTEFTVPGPTTTVSTTSTATAVFLILTTIYTYTTVTSTVTQTTSTYVTVVC